MGVHGKMMILPYLLQYFHDPLQTHADWVFYAGGDACGVGAFCVGASNNSDGAAFI